MNETNPGKILQMHGIEVSPQDERSTEQILAAYVAAGFIAVQSEIQATPQENAL